MDLTFGKTLAKHRKRKNLSQADIVRELGRYGFSVRNTAVSSWEKGRSVPSAAQFLSLCKILGITDIYSEFIGDNPDNPLEGLNGEGRAKALDYIRLLVLSGEYKEPECNILPFTRAIKLYDLPASAGPGELLDGERYEEIEAGPKVPASADFGIRISGDSMEPLFKDGQIVWVRQTKQINDGEIGIFYLDGKAYCKKLRDNADGLALISLNSGYEPIEITENSSFYTFGVVVGP